MAGKSTPGVFNANNPNKGGQAKPNFAALAKKIIDNRRNNMSEERRMEIANKSRSANPNWKKEIRNGGGPRRPGPLPPMAGGRPLEKPPLFRSEGMIPKLNRRTQV